MFRLIKREIQDSMMYFLLTLILTSIFIFVDIFLAYYSSDTGEVAIDINNSFTIFVISTFLFVITAMGVSQMHSDRSKKISSFLSTLAVTRDKILIARVIAGILAILLFFIPQIAAISVVYNLFITPTFAFDNMFIDVYIIASLIAMSCYCIGLHIGWTSQRQIPLLAALPCAFVLITIMYIKGFGIQALFLLVLFIAAYLIRIRDNFITSSL